MKKGFTLVEIAIVVFIVMILVSVSAASFIRGRANYQKALLTNNVNAEINVPLERGEVIPIDSKCEIRFLENGILFSMDDQTFQILKQSFVVESISIGGITFRSDPPTKDVVIKLKRK